jgi:hypothetical protein
MISTTFVRKYFALHTQGESIATPKNNNDFIFFVDKEKNLCISFLHILQDPVIGNG